MTPLEPLYRRDFRRLRKLGEALIRQADHYERNRLRGDDTIRALLAAGYAQRAAEIATRMARRWKREHQ